MEIRKSLGTGSHEEKHRLIWEHRHQSGPVGMIFQPLWVAAPLSAGSTSVLAKRSR
jgi:hypothetical protein